MICTVSMCPQLYTSTSCKWDQRHEMCLAWVAAAQSSVTNAAGWWSSWPGEVGVSALNAHSVSDGRILITDGILATDGVYMGWTWLHGYMGMQRCTACMSTGRILVSQCWW